jgi:predicted amidohydrolase YtcJ
MVNPMVLCCRRLLIAFAVSAAGFGTGACARASSQAPGADLLIVNGRVQTMAPVDGTAEALAIRGNTIVRVGTRTEVEKLRRPDSEVIDAHGSSVVPGFNDSHVHFLSGSLALDEVDLSGLTRLEDIQARIREFTRQHPDTPWIRGRGWLYSPFPGGLPTKEQLDSVVADRPAVMTCYDGHSIWVNSRALAVAGITRATPDPKNGIVVKDAKSGEPTGVLKEAAQRLLTRSIPAPSREQRLAALRAGTEHAHRLGVTSIQSTSGSADELELFDAARRRGDLRLRTYYSLLISPGFSQTDADRFDEVWRRHPDDPVLKTGIVKISADGVIESRTAALLAPYEGTSSAGAPNFSAAELDAIIAMMDRRGWQIQVHAIGDRTIRMTLDAFERAARSNPPVARGRRHRIEHIETIDPAEIPRFGALGVIASMQPMHVVLGDMNSLHPSGPWPDNLGIERAMRAWQWKSIRDAGARITFGSDWGVATLDPLQGIWLATTRVTPGRMQEQRLSMTDAIAAYTIGPAYASFEETRKGTLAPGMLADAVILSRDIVANPPRAPSDVVVDTTIYDGKVVYRRAPGSR